MANNLKKLCLINGGIKHIIIAGVAGRDKGTISKIMTNTSDGSESTQAAVLYALNKILREMEIDTQYTLLDIFPDGPSNGTFPRKPKPQ